MQALYGIIAMSLVTLLAMTLQRGMSRSDQRKAFNEVSTQLSAIGVDVFQHIAARPFDSAADTNKVVIFPPVTNAAQLTPEASFGGCTDYELCEDVDDFHGMSVTMTEENIPYQVDIEVRYVNENNPDTPTGGPQTFCKQVRLSITNPYMYVGHNAPLTVDMHRVYTHQLVTALPTPPPPPPP